jgi:hypothetical protein
MNGCSAEAFPKDAGSSRRLLSYLGMMGLARRSAPGGNPVPSVRLFAEFEKATHDESGSFAGD